MTERRRIPFRRDGKLFTRLRSFLQECWGELRLVQRPSREEVMTYSAAVLLAVVIFAGYLALLDILFNWLFRLLPLGGAS